MQRVFGKSRKVFRSILSSYLLILLLPLAIGGVAFSITAASLRQQVQQVATISVQQLSGTIDSYLTDAAGTGRMLLNQDRVQALKYEKERFERNSLYGVLRVLQDMRLQVSINDMVQNIYLTYPSSGAVLTTGGLYYGEGFASICARELGISYDVWQEIASFNRYRQFRFFDTPNGPQLLVLLTPAVTSRDMPSDIVAVVQIDMEQLAAAFEQSSAHGQFQTLLLQGDAVPLSSSNAANLGAEDVRSAVLKAPRLFLTESVTALYSSSVLPAASYAFILPTHGYLRSIQIVMIAIAIYFALCLVGGSLLAVFLTRRQYTPLQRIAQSLLARLDKSPQQDDDEYSVLNRSLTSLLAREQSQQTLLDEYAEGMRSHVLRRLLQGHARPDQLAAEGLGQAAITLPPGAVLVFITEIDDTQNALLDESGQEDEDMLSVLTLMISSAASQLLPKGCVQYTTQLGDAAVTIVDVPDALGAQGPGERDLSTAVAALRQSLQQRVGISISTAQSSLQGGVNSIALCYRQAQEAAEYIAMFGLRAGHVRYDDIADIEDAQEGGVALLQEEIRLLMNCMRAGDYISAREMLGQMFDEHFKQGQCTLREAKLRMSGVMSSMIAAFEELRPSIDSDFFEQLNPISKLYHADSIAQLEGNVYALMDALIDYAQTQRSDQRTERDQEIVDYVRQHYADHDLTVASISEHFGLSASYLSRLFKQATGMAPLDYIHQLRVHRAKELIVTTDHSIKDIAEMVGYWNALTMTRAFRKFEGITPGLYRETMQKGSPTP